MVNVFKENQERPLEASKDFSLNRSTTLDMLNKGNNCDEYDEIYFDISSHSKGEIEEFFQTIIRNYPIFGKFESFETSTNQHLVFTGSDHLNARISTSEIPAETPSQGIHLVFPLPPIIEPVDLLKNLLNKKSQNPRLPNEYFIYRMALVQQLKATGYKFRMTLVSKLSAILWQRCGSKEKNKYRKIAYETEKLFNVERTACWKNYQLREQQQERQNPVEESKSKQSEARGNSPSQLEEIPLSPCSMEHDPTAVMHLSSDNFFWLNQPSPLLNTASFFPQQLRRQTDDIHSLDIDLLPKYSDTFLNENTGHSTSLHDYQTIVEWNDYENSMQNYISPLEYYANLN
ncbi:hypothetical protein G9A89_011511 [Geosiphon pyriformis]|nr:hypothetical protein G9A89_011511 [Geosiphon pyriformis]